MWNLRVQGSALFLRPGKQNGQTGSCGGCRAGIKGSGGGSRGVATGSRGFPRVRQSHCAPVLLCSCMLLLLPSGPGAGWGGDVCAPAIISLPPNFFCIPFLPHPGPPGRGRLSLQRHSNRPDSLPTLKPRTVEAPGNCLGEMQRGSELQAEGEDPSSASEAMTEANMVLSASSLVLSLRRQGLSV